LIATYADASREWREGTSRIGRIAELDQELAEAIDNHLLAMQELVISANVLFSLMLKLGDLHRHLWYVAGGPYSPEMERSHVESIRSWNLDSGEILGDLSLLEARGRSVEGAEEYRENVRRAEEILEEAAIREQARRMMPSLDRLDALADAHLRSIDG
jgi:hypothetical protein